MDHVEFGGQEKCIQGLVWKPEEKRPPGRPKPRREDNIKINLQDAGCRGINWIDLAPDRER
jgi:hypothetical protein